MWKYESLDPKTSFITWLSYHVFRNQGALLKVTWRTCPLGGFVQAHRYHSINCHWKLSGNFLNFHSTPYPRIITSYILKYVIIRNLTLRLFCHHRLNINRVKMGHDPYQHNILTNLLHILSLRTIHRKSLKHKDTLSWTWLPIKALHFKRPPLGIHHPHFV